MSGARSIPVIRSARGAAALALGAALFAGSAGFAQEAPEVVTETPARALPEPPPIIRAMLIDAALQPTKVTLVSIEEGAVVYLDSRGNRRQAIIGSLMALIPVDASVDSAMGVGAPAPRRDLAGARERREPGPAPAADPRISGLLAGARQPEGALELTDGQRFPGELVPTGGHEDAVAWSHPRFKQIEVPLESVARLLRDTADSGAADLRPGAEDQLLLTNGDRLEGFLITLADNVEIETDSGITRLPADRVAGAAFSNPRSARRGMVVWLDDGTIARAGEISLREGQDLSVRLPGGQSAEYSPESLRGIAFEAGRLMALSALEPRSQRPLPPRRRAELVRLALHPDDPASAPSGATLDVLDIEFPGPMEVDYALPEGVQRFAATVALAPDSAPWGDCEVVVRVDGQEKWRKRLSQAEPSAPLSLPLSARELSISVEPGMYGPIQDWVVLRRPMLLVEAPAGG